MDHLAYIRELTLEEIMGTIDIADRTRLYSRLAEDAEAAYIWNLMHRIHTPKTGAFLLRQIKQAKANKSNRFYSAFIIIMQLLADAMLSAVLIAFFLL